MTIEANIKANKAILKRFWDEGFNQVDANAVSEFVAADYHNHDMAAGEQNGIEGLLQFMRLTHAAFPDMRVIADKIVAEGDIVVTRWSVTGTHNGEFMGVPPTGRPITITGLAMHRIENGKIKEGWNNWDALGLLKQVGALPTK
jgi:steroid delta-isomerase-like uncharacterized protein